MITHGFVSAFANGPNAQKLQPSHWNNEHKWTGGADGAVLVRDSSTTVTNADGTQSGGANWRTIYSGQVRIAGTLRVDGVGPHGIGAAPLTGSTLRIGAGDVGAPGISRYGVVINDVLTPDVSGNAWQFIVAANVTKQATGTHPVVVGAELDWPHVTNPGAGGVITDLVAVRIGADGAVPYANATNCYGIEMTGGIIFAHGGEQDNTQRPAILMTNRQIITWKDAANGFTNQIYFYPDANNHLNIGTQAATRFILTNTGSIQLFQARNVPTDTTGNFVQNNNAYHSWLDASGTATSAGFITTNA